MQINPSLILKPGTTVLLTGASGFTGSVVAKKLSALGVELRAIARSSSDISALKDLNIKWFRGEVYDPETVRLATEGVNYIFHVAAAFRNAGIEKDEYRRVHLDSTKLLVEAAAKQPEFKRLVQVSTMGVHGHIENPPGNEDSEFSPGDEYQRTKAAAEQWLTSYAKENKFPYTIIRPTGIFGPGDRRLLKVFKMATLPVFPVLGQGKCLYHLIHVEDLADAIILAAVHPAANAEAFLVGNTEAISMIDVGKLVAERLGRKLKVLRIPAGPFFLLADICEAICQPLKVRPPIYRRRVAFFTKDRSFDVSKIKNLLGFAPRLSNTEGILQTADWYIKNGWLGKSKTDNVQDNLPRVLLINPQPFFELRGSSLRAQTMAEALSDSGFAVDFLTYGYGENIALPSGVQQFRCARIPGISRIPIGPSFRKIPCDIALAFSAVRLVSSRRYQVIHGLEEAGIIAAIIGFICRKPYVFDMHSHMSEQLSDHSNPLFKAIAVPMRWIERLCVKGSSGVVTVSDQLTGFAQESSPSVPAVTIHDAPLDSATKVEQSISERIIHEFKLQNKDLVVYTGNFEPYQGVELLLQGFAKYLQLYTEPNSTKTVLLVVGGPADKQDSQRRILENRVAELGISAQVVFTGPRPAAEMGSFMALAKALVSPRTTGGNTPLKIYSYMAAKAPIVATRVNSHTQVLDENCSYLCSPDAEGIATALQECLSESDESLARRISISRGASDKLESSFTKERFYEKVRSLYSRISYTIFYSLSFCETIEVLFLL